MGALGACTSSAATHMLQPIFLVPLMDWPDVSSVQVGLTSSLFFAGYAVGVFAWAAYSDGRGRRPTILASFLVGNLGGIGSFFAPTFHTFLALRCLCGFGVGGLKNAVFLLGTEFAPPAARAQVSALVSYFWLCGLLWLVGCAYLLQDRSWRWLGLAHIPALLVQARAAQFGAMLRSAPHFSDARFTSATGADRPAGLPAGEPSILARRWRSGTREARRQTGVQGERRAAAGAALPAAARCLRRVALHHRSALAEGDAPRHRGHRVLAGRVHDDGAPPPPPPLPAAATSRRRRRGCQPPPPPPPPASLLTSTLLSLCSSTQSRSRRSSTS
jgi:MFS family permease